MGHAEHFDAEHFERQNVELIAAVDLVTSQGYATREHVASVHEHQSPCQ